MWMFPEFVLFVSIKNRELFVEARGSGKDPHHKRNNNRFSKVKNAHRFLLCKVKNCIFAPLFK